MRHHSLCLALAIVCAGAFALVGCGFILRALDMPGPPGPDGGQNGQDQPPDVAEAARQGLYQVIAAAIAGAGTIAAAVLARLLARERKLTKAVIQGVEAADGKAVKETIRETAAAAGVEDPLRRRVQAVT